MATQENDSVGERGWERAKKRILAKGGTKAKHRRVSAGDVDSGGRPTSLMPPSGSTSSGVEHGGRRRVSTGMVNTIMSGGAMTEDPTEMGEIEEDAEGEESIDEDELPNWARSTAFVGDDLGELVIFTAN